MLSTNQKAAENVSDQLSAYFTKVQHALKIIASNKSIQENQELLDDVNYLLPEFNVLAILNPHGDIIKMSGNTNKPVLTNLSSKEYFLQAMKGNNVITNIFTTVSGKKVIAIAVPIQNDNIIDGVIIAYIDLYTDSLSSMFGNKSFGENGYISILDSNGFNVYTKDQDRIGQQSTIFDNLGSTCGSLKLEDFTGSEQYIGYNKVPNLNWTVVVSTPTNTVKKARYLMISDIVILSMSGIAIIIIIGLYSVKQSIKPFKELMSAFEELPSGKYTSLETNKLPKELHNMANIYNNSVKILATKHHKLEKEATTDLLTGAYNRRCFYSMLHGLEAASYQSSNHFSIAIIDLDNFKMVNDTKGHIRGDAILKLFTNIMASTVGRRYIFRLGGDEFIILFENKSYKEILTMLEKIRLDTEKLLDGCTASMGIATFPQDTTIVTQMIKLADEALYVSKAKKNKVTFYKDIY